MIFAKRNDFALDGTSHFGYHTIDAGGIAAWLKIESLV